MPGARWHSRPGNVVVAAAAVAACSPGEPAVEALVDQVVVYAAEEYRGTISPLFEQYEDESGTIVIVRFGAPRDVVADLIRNDISPPADLLLTSSVMAVWPAAEEGALRPMHSQAADELIPAWARDTDDLWLGLRFDAAVIAPAVMDLPDDFASLADGRFANRLCLSSPANPINQVVIAMLIDSQGARQAELTVRGWVRNMALPVFATEEALAGALGDGRCQAGIVSASVADAAGLSRHRMRHSWGDVDAIGVARHARNPDAALRLAEWLIRQMAPSGFAGSGQAGEKNVGLAAWYRDDAVRLAERAGYR